MTDDLTDDLTGDDPGSQQLRKVLGAMNDLEPPTDELFAQRAIVRGRARTARRRSSVVGAAAALVVVAGGGGVWWAAQSSGPNVATSASAPEAARDDAGSSGSGGSEVITKGLAPAAPFDTGARVQSARDDSGWFAGRMTPQRAALESLAPELTTTFAQSFSGAWSRDETNEHLVVALSARNADLERRVTSALPSPSDVEFVVASHSYADKAALATRIRADLVAWQEEGISIGSVSQDFRGDRVVVVASGADASSRITSRYGGAEWVSVTVLVPSGQGKPPDGTTLPTPHR